MITRYQFHRSWSVLRLTACCRVCFVQGLHGWYTPNPVSLCRIDIGLTSQPGLPEWLLILTRFGAVVSHPRLQIRLGFPSFPFLTPSRPASPVELDIESGRLFFLLLHVEWLLALDLSAVIAAVISGVLFRWAWLAVFGTKVRFVVSAAAASAMHFCLSAFVDFLSEPRRWW